MSKIEKGNLYNAAASTLNIIFDPIIKKSLKCSKCDFETSKKKIVCQVKRKDQTKHSKWLPQEMH